MHTVHHADAPHWYAIHTKPKQEDRAERNLRAWRVQTFTPLVREQRLRLASGGRSHIVKPLFPRYIFARFKACDLLHKVGFTRGVQSVVCFGGNPSPVEDEIIEIIRSRMDESGFIKVGDELLPGDKVVICSGYLKDFAGVFEGKLRDQDRITILLTTISYQGRVVIEREWVRKVS